MLPDCTTVQAALLGSIFLPGGLTTAINGHPPQPTQDRSTSNPHLPETPGLLAGRNTPPTTYQKGHPAMTTTTRKNVELLDHTEETLRKAMFWTIIMCVVLGISEAATAQTVLLDFTRNAFLAWILATAVTTSANFASYLAGATWHHSKATSAALATAWLIVGGVLVYLRLHHSSIPAPTPTISDTATTSDQVQAVLLGSIYLLGGLVTAIKGYTNNRPDIPANPTAPTTPTTPATPA